MITPPVSGHFVPGCKGDIFVLLRRPVGAPRGCVLVAPPFAEEMNKCRRMVTELSLLLSEAGWATLIPDLYGTGDSVGDFGDADLSYWREDLVAATRWSEQEGFAVDGLLAIRLGCAIACSILDRIGSLSTAVLWQPVFDGDRFLRQFLRLRLAASLMDDKAETVTELRERLAAGESLEVAGYELGPRLASALGALKVPVTLPAALGKTLWLESVRNATDSTPVSMQELITRSGANGCRVERRTIPGEPFWAATEIVVNRPFLVATRDHFVAGAAGDHA